jgi:hypothetical protein
MNPGATFQLLTRSGCHLCETYAEQLAERFPAVFERLVLCQVDDRADWRERYGLRIPVLLCNEVLIGEGLLDETAIRQALAAAA